jgi:hypothetical protein
MAEIINHQVIFSCVHCGREFKRTANSQDYLGRFTLPEGWGFWRIFSSFKYFCDSKDCQNLLEACTKGS